MFVAMNICLIRFSEIDQYDHFKNTCYFEWLNVELRYPVNSWPKALRGSLNLDACKKAKIA